MLSFVAFGAPLAPFWGTCPGSNSPCAASPLLPPLSPPVCPAVCPQLEPCPSSSSSRCSPAALRLLHSALQSTRSWRRGAWRCPWLTSTRASGSSWGRTRQGGVPWRAACAALLRAARAVFYAALCCATCTYCPASPCFPAPPSLPRPRTDGGAAQSHAADGGGVGRRQQRGGARAHHTLRRAAR